MVSTYQLTVSGHVQGVGYRRFVQKMAETLQYVGYVRNLSDGSVDVVVNAEYEEELEFFISKLYDGTLFSDVQTIICKKIDTMIFDAFEKR